MQLSYSTLKKAFTDHTSPSYNKVNDFFAFITVLSILSLVLETVESLDPYLIFFQALEWITVALFTIEYILRFLAADKKLKYLISFYGIVDLAAILPSFLGVSNFSFLKVARIYRILNLFRMMHLIKVLRLSRETFDNEAHRTMQQLSIRLFVLVLFLSVSTFGTLIYLVEGPPQFPNIPVGMLWILKLTVGGLAHTAPSTVTGDLISIGARLIGLLLFGLIIHIVGKAIEKRLVGPIPLE